jgi:sugar phosphate isomerase/epimerase
MADVARLSLNTITLRSLSLGECIELCVRHDIRAIGPWRDKIAEYGCVRAAKHIRDAGLRVSGVCRGGMFNAAAAADDNRRAIDEAAALGADCLVMGVGGLHAGSKDLAAARAGVADGLAAMLPHARACGLKIALEPLHPMTCADRSVLSTTAQALDLCDALGEGVGVALDVYHVWWDPALPESIRRAGNRIFAFHVCDWLVPTRDLVFDRGMMGDGVIDIPSIRTQVEAAGFFGAIEVEIMSEDDWWRREPDDVARVLRERFAECV